MSTGRKLDSALWADVRRLIIACRRDHAETKGVCHWTEREWLSDDEPFRQLALQVDDSLWAPGSANAMAVFVEPEAIALVLEKVRTRYDLFAVLGRASMFVRTGRISVQHVATAIRKLRKEKGVIRRIDDLLPLELVCAAQDGRILVHVLRGGKRKLGINPLYKAR